MLHLRINILNGGLLSDVDPAAFAIPVEFARLVFQNSLPEKYKSRANKNAFPITKLHISAFECVRQRSKHARVIVLMRDRNHTASVNGKTSLS